MSGSEGTECVKRPDFEVLVAASGGTKIRVWSGVHRQVTLFPLSFSLDQNWGEGGSGMTVFSFKKAFPSQKVQCSQHCSFLSKYSFSRRKYFKKDLVKIHPRTTKYPSKQKLWELPQDNISTASWIYEACFPWQWGSTVTLSWAGMMPLAN